MAHFSGELSSNFNILLEMKWRAGRNPMFDWP